MAEAHIVGRAVVQVSPVFTDSQRTIAKEITPAAKRAGKQAGQEAGREMGDGIADGVRQKTKTLEAEISRIGKSAASAAKQVNAATQKSTAAAEKERAAADALRVATEKLEATRGRANVQAKDLIAVQRELSKAMQQHKTAQAATARADEQLSSARARLTDIQDAGRAATERLAVVQDEATAAANKNTSATEEATTATEQSTEATRNAAGATQASTEANDTATRSIRSLEREVRQHGRAVNATAAEVERATTQAEAAARREREANDNVRQSTEELARVRRQANVQTADIIFAQRDLSRELDRQRIAMADNAAATDNLRAAREKSTAAQEAFGSSSERLTTHLRTISRENTNTERSTSRLATMFSRAFDKNNSPLSNMAKNINRDSDSVTKRLRTLADDVGNAGTRGGRAFSRFATLFTAGLVAIPPLLGGVSAALLGAVGAVVTFSDSLSDLVGIAALAPAALVAVGSAVGVLRAAFAGMGTALEESVKSQAKVANDSAANAAALEDASARIADAQEYAAQVREDSARRIADAEKGVTDATEQAAEDQAAALRKVEDARYDLGEAITKAAADQKKAARDVVSAEADVARANRQARDAQQALNDARKEAVDRIDDLNDALKGAGLSERDAVISLEEARIALQEGVDDGADAGSLRMRKLVLGVDQAAFALEEARERSEELRKDQAQVTAEGIEGNRDVVRAKRDLADAEANILVAQQKRRDAEEEVNLAELRGIQEVATARRDLDDAVAEATQTKIDGAESIRDAEIAVADAVRDSQRSQKDAADALADAQRALTREQLRQADKAADAGAKAAEAMANLSPNARIAAEALLAVYERLKGIKNVIQDNFFAGFLAPFTLLADTLLPQVEAGAGRIATVLGQGMQQLMTSLTGALGNGVLETLLNSVATILTNLIPAIDPLIQAFTTLALVGMPYMEAFATAISDAAFRFNEFIQTAAGDGSLNTWIDDGIQGLRDIGGIIAATTGIFNALADAARAGGIDVTLGSLADGLDRIRTLMEGPVFQKTMSTIFQGAANGAAGLRDGLKMLGDAFVVGAPAFAEFLELGGKLVGLFVGNLSTMLADPAFGEGLTNFLEALLDGAEEITPLLPGLAEALGSVLTDLAPIFRELGPTLIEVITNIANAIESVLDFLSPMLTAMAGSPGIVTLFLAAFVGTNILASLATFAANLSAIITVGGKLGPILGFIGKAVGKLFTLLKFGSPFGWVVLGITALVTALQWFFTQTEIGRELWAGFVSGLKDAWAAVSEWFMNEALPAIKGFFTDVPGSLKAIGKDIILGFLDAFTGGNGALVFDAIGEWVNGVIQWVKDLFGIQSPSTIFAEIGNFLIQGLVNGIKAAGQLLLDALGAISTFFSNTWSAVTKTISDAMTWAYNWINQKMTQIQVTWAYVWAVIKNKLLEIWIGIKSTVANALEWVRSWIQTKLDNIKRNWDFVWNYVKDKVQAIWAGIKSLISAAIEWVRNWIQTKLDNIKRNWTILWDAIKTKVSTVWTAIRVTVSDAWTRVKSTLTTLIDFVKNNLAQAFEKAKEGIKTAWDKLKNVAKTPVKFVIEEVIQKGIIEKFNGFLPKGMKIPDVKVPKGWKDGGYTGDGPADEVAGPAHRGEFYFSKKRTAELGRENLAALAHGTIRKGHSGCAASIGKGNMGDFFQGNANAIAANGAYYMDVAKGLDGWNFPAAARMWDGAAGIKVKTGKGKTQGRVTALERGGGILGYTTGSNIDMSPSWMRQLSPKQRTTVAAHEAGHAMGLPHNSLRSIMQPNLANMASAPTTIDIQNLQKLFPGGTGKAGDGGADENPFKGLFKNLVQDLMDKFPGNLIAKVAGGVALSGIDKVFSMVEDIKNGISKLAGNVVNGIKNFFGGGDDAAMSTEPMLFRDDGGYIPPGISRILNATGQNEYAMSPKQINDMHSFVMGRGNGRGDTWNVQLPEKASVDQLMNAVRFEERRNARVGARR